MTKLQLLFIVVAVFGFILIGIGSSGERQGKEPPPLAQTGYLALIVGVFGLLAQFMSFPAAMLVFLLIAGLLIAIDKLWLHKQRGEAPRHDAIEYSYSFFPIILVVFLIRSFVAEPFQIPSSSMRPGLVPHDFILVNKFAYGLRIPILNKVFVPIGLPQRGDVMVFEWPVDRSTNFIKRVIGVPGDVVEYRDKKLYINGQPQAQTPDGQGEYQDDNSLNIRHPMVLSEKLGAKTHRIYQDEGYPVFDPTQVSRYREVGAYTQPDACEYDMDEGRWFRCKVPAGHYFMMGDNRDNSGDSRYWGMVPDDHIVGKAFFVWFNTKQLSRIGTKVR